jgi:uncharacterized membrane protein YbjE (DUF340 family)
MKDSIIIVFFFIIGVILGVTHCYPESLLQNHISHYTLCALMFCVGVSIGNDRDIFKKIKTIPIKLALLPLFTIIGTLAGCFVISLFLSHRSAVDCMAVGSGFGYYSLSSILITEYKGSELGALGLLANINRELMALLLVPWFASFFGKLAPISVGGATTMDTTLPIISKYTSKEFIIVAIYHGIVVDFSVPFLVTFFCSI